MASMSDRSHDSGKTKAEVVTASVDVKDSDDDINIRLANPLARYTTEELGRMGEEYAIEYNIGEAVDVRAFRYGAILAQNPNFVPRLDGLTTDEIAVLDKELTHKWSQPVLMYLVIALCSACAAVQGMDQTVVNGAQIFYAEQFGIGDKESSRDAWLLGLTNAAPYLCCAFIGCWFTIPFNHWFGRRGSIFVTCFISAAACLWQAFTNTWWHMFIARFAMGMGIGPKSATVPMYAAETSPPRIRGALVMMWQCFTAFGILLGYAADLALFRVPDFGIPGLRWRLMMGSAMLPAIVVCVFVFFCPESPRYYMNVGKHQHAYRSMCRLRYNSIQAARDIFYIHIHLEIEKEEHEIGKNKVKELFTIPRNRRAMIASQIVMFLQQFCGVNVICYYSSEIFLQANMTEFNALLASLGWGIINFLFAIPAIYTIDTFGRRNLLLTTFPLMALCLFFTGFSFYIPAESVARFACVVTGLYLFGIVYSPGEGPVPFTYSAEAYPLYIRPLGMSLATATTWFFNFVLAMTFPSLLQAFMPQGAFAWYGMWNIVGFFAVLFCVPETKGKTLEELDQVFNISNYEHAAYGWKQLKYFFKRWIFFQDVQAPNLVEAGTVVYRPETFAVEREGDASKRV